MDLRNNAGIVPAPSNEKHTGYQLVMLVLCIFALLSLAAQNVFHLTPEISSVLDYADIVVCSVFLIDFAFSLKRAPNRWKYFVTWGWLDLISSIPTLDVGRWGRLARIARIARVLRGLRAMRLVGSLVLRNRSKNTLLGAALTAMLLVFACSSAVLHFEAVEGNIKTAEDAIWWSFATITTVGYGDRFPVTTEGRLIAALLMTAGVGLFGVFSASMAAWFLAPEEQQIDNDVAAVRDEVAALRKAVEQLVAKGS